MTTKRSQTFAEVVRAAEVLSRKQRRYELSLKDVRAYLDAFFALIKGSVADGGRIGVPGFGTFALATRRARTVKHPRNGTVVALPECWQVTLRPSKHAKGVRR